MNREAPYTEGRGTADCGDCDHDHRKATRFDEAAAQLDDEYEPNYHGDGEPPWSGFSLAELERDGTVGS